MPDKDLLLIVDMQNVYLPGYPWACPSLPSAICRIQMLLNSPSCGKHYDVIFTRHIASRQPQGRWKLYNRNTRSVNQDPFLCQLIPSFQPYLEIWPCYDKSVYSACSIRQITKRLTQYRRILLCGVVAECCILATAEDLIDTGVQLIYLKDAVAGQEPEYEHIICRLMERFVPVHTLVMTAEDYLACFSIHSTQSE